MAENHNRETYTEHRCSSANTPGGWDTSESYPMSKGDIPRPLSLPRLFLRNTFPNKMRLYCFEVKMNIINNMPLIVPELSVTLRTPEPKADNDILQK